VIKADNATGRREVLNNAPLNQNVKGDILYCSCKEKNEEKK
jgi:hypothetical protein